MRLRIRSFGVRLGLACVTAAPLLAPVPASGQLVGSSCPPGTYGVTNRTTGAVTCTACSPGSFQPYGGQISCRPADVGYYVPTSGAVSELPCATALTTGSTTCGTPTPPLINSLTSTTMWTAASFTASDVGVGANGGLWWIGTDGASIWQMTSAGAKQMPGGAVRIAVDPSGNAWVVNAGNQIWYWNGSTWILEPGAAQDIAVGSNGAVWSIALNKVPQRWNGSTWVPASGGGEQISVGPNGDPYVTNAAGQLWHYVVGTASWALYGGLPAPATDLAVRADGSVLVTCTDNKMYSCTDPNTACTLVGAFSATRVAAGPSTVAYAVAGGSVVKSPGSPY